MLPVGTDMRADPTRSGLRPHLIATPADLPVALSITRASADRILDEHQVLMAPVVMRATSITPGSSAT